MTLTFNGTNAVLMNYQNYPQEDVDHKARVPADFANQFYASRQNPAV